MKSPYITMRHFESRLAVYILHDRSVVFTLGGLSKAKLPYDMALEMVDNCHAYPMRGFKTRVQLPKSFYGITIDTELFLEIKAQVRHLSDYLRNPLLAALFANTPIRQEIRRGQVYQDLVKAGISSDEAQILAATNLF